MAKKRANGEGNIRKRSDGRWEGRYTAGYHPDTGKRIIKNVLGRTQAEVKAKLKQAIGEAGSLDVARAGKYTVAEWLRLWFEVYAKPNLRFSTAEYYWRGIELHTIPYIGEVKLNQLTTRQIQNLYRELQQNGRRRAVQKSKRPGLSSSTIRGVHTMLHSALDRAVKEKLLLHNPAEDCVVPKENLLGKEGQGFKIAMQTLDGGRIGIAAQALGLGEGAIDEAVKYTQERVQFGRRLSQFQNTQFQLADMATKVEAAKMLVYKAARKKDEYKTNPKISYSVEAAMAKLYAAEVAMEVTTKAVQLHGGYGYIREYEVERMMRDAKITEIYEGTSEVQRMVISANLGVN